MFERVRFPGFLGDTGKRSDGRESDRVLVYETVAELGPLPASDRVHRDIRPYARSEGTKAGRAGPNGGARPQISRDNPSPDATRITPQVMVIPAMRPKVIRRWLSMPNRTRTRPSTSAPPR